MYVWHVAIVIAIFVIEMGVEHDTSAEKMFNVYQSLAQVGCPCIPEFGARDGLVMKKLKE